MKRKKEFKYHLKKEVRDDLEFFNAKLLRLLCDDVEGFDSIPVWSNLLALFKAYSRLIWYTQFDSWFKKVYKS